MRWRGTDAIRAAIKRSMDVIVSAVALVALSPLFLAIALLVVIDSPGPVFYRAERVGFRGRRLRMLKFRKMHAAARGAALTVAGDPRLTRTGAWLARTKLDELPQFWHVLRGEMSLVGPRPLVTDEDALVLGLDRSRLHLTPGMTGPWQVLGARVPMQEMVGIDYLYVASWSLWLDLKLLIRTARHVLRRGNV